MSKEKTTDKPLLSTLRELEVGKSVTYPISRRSYVCSACTRFGMEWDKEFKTTSSRENKTVTVTRTA